MKMYIQNIKLSKTLIRQSQADNAEAFYYIFNNEFKHGAINLLFYEVQN